MQLSGARVCSCWAIRRHWKTLHLRRIASAEVSVSRRVVSFFASSCLFVLGHQTSSEKTSICVALLALSSVFLQASCFFNALCLFVLGHQTSSKKMQLRRIASAEIVSFVLFGHQTSSQNSASLSHWRCSVLGCTCLFVFGRQTSSGNPVTLSHC